MQTNALSRAKSKNREPEQLASFIKRTKRILEELVAVWYTFESIAKELGIPVKTIYFFHKRGDGPRVHKFGKHLRVLEDDFSAWKTKQIINK